MIFFQFRTFLLIFLLPAVFSRPTNEVGNFDEMGPYLGGDVILPPGFDIQGGIVGENLRWPNKTLIYHLDPSFTQSELATIHAAMVEITNLTCIRFQPRQAEIGYIFISRGEVGTGCFSYLGRLGTVQELNLEAPGCITKGIVMHEFDHAIGFYHEQSREDRDDYVTINWSNVKPGTEFNFLKASISLRYNVTYDYGSLMHYSKTSFASDPSIPTIITLDPEAIIGQRQGFSQKDIYKIQAMYCPEENGEIPI